MLAFFVVGHRIVKFICATIRQLRIRYKVVTNCSIFFSYHFALFTFSHPGQYTIILWGSCVCVCVRRRLKADNWQWKEERWWKMEMLRRWWFYNDQISYRIFSYTHCIYAVRTYLLPNSEWIRRANVRWESRIHFVILWQCQIRFVPEARKWDAQRRKITISMYILFVYVSYFFFFVFFYFFLFQKCNF